jgi:peptide deformylase
MILPILPNGLTILRQQYVPISKDYPGLNQLTVNMWKTFSRAKDHGLVTPLINLAINIIVINSTGTF